MANDWIVLESAFSPKATKELRCQSSCNTWWICTHRKWNYLFNFPRRLTCVAGGLTSQVFYRWTFPRVLKVSHFCELGLSVVEYFSITHKVLGFISGTFKQTKTSPNSEKKMLATKLRQEPLGQTSLLVHIRSIPSYSFNFLGKTKHAQRCFCLLFLWQKLSMPRGVPFLHFSTLNIWSMTLT